MLIIVGIVVALGGLVATAFLAGRARYVSPPLTFLALYVIMIHVGALLAFRNNPVANRLFLTVSSVGIGAFVVGCLTIRIAGADLRGPIRNSRGMQRSLGPVVMWRLFAGIAIIGGLVYVGLGYRAAGTIPLFHSGHYAVWKASRHAFKQFAGYGYISELANVLLPVVSIYFLLRDIQRRRWPRARVICLMLVVAFVLAAPGHRGPLLIYVFMIAIAVSYLRGGFSPYKYLLGGAVGVLLFAGFTLVSGASRYNSESLVTNTAVRIFKEQALGPRFVYQRFASRRLMGASYLDDLDGVLPGRQQGFSAEIPELRGKKSHNNPTGVTAEAFMNFGYIGVIVQMWLWGVITYLLHVGLLKYTRRGDAGGVALFVGGAFAMSYGAIAGLVGVLFQFGVVLVILMYLIFSVAGLLGWRDTDGTGDRGHSGVAG